MVKKKPIVCDRTVLQPKPKPALKPNNAKLTERQLLFLPQAFSHLNNKGFTGHGFFVGAITAGTVGLIFCGVIVFAAGRFCERYANELSKLLVR